MKSTVTSQCGHTYEKRSAYSRSSSLPLVIIAIFLFELWGMTNVVLTVFELAPHSLFIKRVLKEKRKKKKKGKKFF